MDILLHEMIVRINKEQRVTCILYDFMLWWVGPLAKTLRTPAYIFYVMSSIFFSYLSHIPVLAAEGLLPLRADTDVSDKSAIFRLRGLPPLHVSEVPDISWSPNALCSFDYTLRSTASWREASGILFNTAYEIEKEVIDSLRERAPEMDIRAVGPVLPPCFLNTQPECGDHSVPNVGNKNARHACLQWLDQHPPSSVIYIAFGTIASLNVNQIHELAMGIEASNQRFLWIIRAQPSTEAELEGKEKNDSMAIGEFGSPFPEGFAERTRERGKIFWGVGPQREILSHKSVGGFLTHCGWNSTLEALCKGIPMLCYPMFGDQGLNCMLLEHIHAGSRLVEGRKGRNGCGCGEREDEGREGFIRREEVEQKMRWLMDLDCPLRSSVSRVRETLCMTALPGGSSYCSLEGFLETINTRDLHLNADTSQDQSSFMVLPPYLK
ncbi:hypothetical protein KP509_05G074600 [Ceratopteris richardii]|nr:hypothetical protein KP509_05G074600 [Ceratopteris richardii]